MSQSPTWRISFSRPAILFFSAALLVWPVCLRAQTVTGTLQGAVTDTSGGVLPGAGIAIHSKETGQQRNLTTNARGSYTATFLPIGKYRVEASLSGFGSVVHENVEVTLNNTTVENFSLDPKISAQVRVTAEAPHIDTTDQEIKGSLNEKQIMDKPTLATGSFLSLAEIFAGFNENPTSGQNNPTLSSGSSVNFNGTGTRGATFQINGVNNDDTSENQHRQNVPVATIQSFQILTNSYSAEFGRGYGSVVLVQTKQGTNNVDGEVYDYSQDNKYISRDRTQVSLDHGQHYRRQFGATAGFPIMRDRLFAFLDTDQVQDKGDVLVTRGVFLPSDLDPSKRLTLGNDTPENRAWQDSIIARFPKGGPNAPNIAARAYQGFQHSNLPKRDLSARGDFNATLSNTLTARYQRSH